MKGTVKWFDAEKGYGFISADGGSEYFVHYSQIDSDGYKSLNENDNVYFEIVDTARGPQATKVKTI
jgi:cold shock protein